MEIEGGMKENGKRRTLFGFTSSAKTRKKITSYEFIAKLRAEKSTTNRKFKKQQEEINKLRGKLEESLNVEKWKSAKEEGFEFGENDNTKGFNKSWLLTKRFGKNLKQSVSENAQAYCLNTTLHGFAYIINGKGGIEKLFWTTIVFLGFLFGGMVVNDAFIDWSENPMITTIDTFSYPVQNIQYPTLTVCYGDNYDPWAYVRNTYNRFELSCQTDGDCARSRKLRDDFDNVLVEVAKDLTNYTCEENWYGLCSNSKADQMKDPLTAYMLEDENEANVDTRIQVARLRVQHVLFNRQVFKDLGHQDQDRIGIFRAFLDAVNETVKSANETNNNATSLTADDNKSVQGWNNEKIALPNNKLYIKH